MKIGKYIVDLNPITLHNYVVYSYDRCFPVYHAKGLCFPVAVGLATYYNFLDMWEK